jgi:hypothetical protein
MPLTSGSKSMTTQTSSTESRGVKRVEDGSSDRTQFNSTGTLF